MPDWTQALLPQLCEPFACAVRALPTDAKERVREIRIRAGRPMLALAEAELFLCEKGPCRMEQAIVPDRDDCRRLLNAMCGHSLYAYEEEMRSGFLTLKGGFRVGLAGRAVVERGEVQKLTQIGGFNIRIARELHGAASRLMPHILAKGGVRSTLILSPPGLGKTTMLRDAVRRVSEAGFSVALADERGEVAALLSGVPQLDVGPRTDVLDGCPKEIALSLLLRSMSPQVIATDELGSASEAVALRRAAAGGVAVLATAHAKDLSQAQKNPLLADILPLFPRIAALGGRPGNIVAIYENASRLEG